MDTAPLKSFATSARVELIREVGARITAVLAQGSPEHVEQPQAVTALERAIAAGGSGDKGRAHVADKVAYTWFNRIIALRFMDANGYTGLGVVSPATDQVGQPEVLAAAKRGQIDGDVVKGASAATIAGLLNGTRQPRPGVDPQAEAYALLLADYCRYWNKAMPFMFEREGDYTELLIPANLLAEDSVLNRSVKVLNEEACQDVEVIGWLYQFYISERKDEVFAGFKKNKKAGADEIPAATQLFTPHWIVRYLVENSVGRLWMLNHPESRLIDLMDYYIPPVDEETDFLKITTPEDLTVIDPACGSGHMLTYAFDLLFAIYEEEGYTPSQIPSLILTNNLYGTEIDPRAGALAAFALTMKAAAKRKLFLKSPVEPNICVLDPISFSADELEYLFTVGGDRHAEEAFWNQFAEADIYGALISPDPDLTAGLKVFQSAPEDLFSADVLERARRVRRQAEYLTAHYSTVVANPPYMDARNMSGELAEFVAQRHPSAATGLDIAFFDRASDLLRSNGYIAFLTMDSWMSSFETRPFREDLLDQARIRIALHLGPGAFDQIVGQVVRVVATVLGGRADRDDRISFLAAADLPRGRKELVFGDTARRYDRPSSWFDPFPLRSIAPFAATDRVHDLYVSGTPLAKYAEARTGLQSGDNARFVRQWFEVGFGLIRQAGGDRDLPWVPYVKSTDASRWFAREDMVIDWRNDGEAVRNHPSSVIRNSSFHFQEGISFAGRGKELKARYVLPGAISDQQNSMVFVKGTSIEFALGLLNSSAAELLVRAASPSKFNIGAMKQIPVAATEISDREVEKAVRVAVRIMTEIWDAKETSPGFAGLGRLIDGEAEGNVERRINATRLAMGEALEAVEAIEVKNDEYFSRYFGVDPDREARSPMAVADAEELVRDLVSYAVGCMFGRYSLDEPGLILADPGVTLSDYLAKVRLPTFMPDADNVIPIVDGDWFEDDIVDRFRQFMRVAFGEEHFEENLRFVTDTLGVKNLRDYFVKSFYKDHVQRYKKRPIYWLFSSPKGSFNALIYMHRYTPSTVSTVLTYLREYVTKLESALQQADRAGNAKEADRLRKVLVELNEYEHDTLFPKASENVVIDLDDGVKANYPKFGAALKKIPGLEAPSD